MSDNKIPTEADRDELKAIFDALDRATDTISEFLRPLRKAEGEILEARELLLERYGVNGIVGKCEACGRILFEGERGHSYADDSGIILCEEHAPTRAEIASEMESIDEEDLQERMDSSKTKPEIIADYLAAGDADEKMVWEL